MNRLFTLLLLASCTASAEPKAAPGPSKPVASELALSPRFDASLLCKRIPDAKAALGSDDDPEVRAFGMTESDPPAPSTVRGVTYRFGAGKGLYVAEMTAKLAELGPLTQGGKTIPANATIETIAALGLGGCGDLQINEGATVLECTAGDVEITFVRGGPLRDAPVEVRAQSSSCEG